MISTASQNPLVCKAASSLETLVGSSRSQKITGFSMLCKWSLTCAHQSVLLQRLHALSGLWPNRTDALSAICLYRTVIPQLLTGEGKVLNSKSCVSMTITCWIIASRNYLVKWKKSIKTDFKIQVAAILQYERKVGDWCVRSRHLDF